MQHLGTPLEAAHWLRSHVTGTLCADSRQLQPGDGFVAWPGAAVDARQFVPAALAQGAAACLVESPGAESLAQDDVRIAGYRGLKAATGEIAAAFFDHPSRDLDVVAVTGTNGKTSTAWWLAQAFSALPASAASQARPCGVIGTLGVGRALANAVTSTGLTTPDPVLLQKTLRQFRQQGLQACAMEASSIGLQEQRLAGTRIRVAVFTNFTQDHLDYHGSMEAYWAAKRALFNWPGLAAVVINIDDERGAALAGELAVDASASGATGLDAWTTSCERPARLQARNIRYGAQGLQFEVVEGGQALTLASALIGSYNVSNLLGVLGAMRALGVPLAAAVAACAHLRPVPGRMECLGGQGAPMVAVDYAHTPDALDHALAALRPMAQQRAGKLWCVFGCGGDRDATKRPLMGAIAARLADCVVITSDNPRTERPETIVAQVLLGCPNQSHVDVEVDRALAIAQTLARAADQDVVLIAGKGHEDYQDVAGSKHPFLDSDHAQRALEARP